MVHYVVDIYGSKSYPMLTHIFHGRTKAEALEMYRRHLKADRFLHGCVHGTEIGCEAEARWEGA